MVCSANSPRQAGGDVDDARRRAHSAKALGENDLPARQRGLVLLLAQGRGRFRSRKSRSVQALARTTQAATGERSQTENNHTSELVTLNLEARTRIGTLV